MIRRILSLDPSYEPNNMGYAWFAEEEGKIYLQKWGTAPSTVSKGATLLEKWHDALGSITRLTAGRELIDYVAIEMPQTWGTYRSAMSSSSGVLHNLFFLVGMIYENMRSQNFNPVLLTTAEWKGQLPKKVTKERMEKRFGIKLATLHEADAVGIGAFFLDQLLKEKK